MVDLTTKERLVRFGENEERVQTFVNETGTYTTTENVQVETLPSFLARKNTEVNTAANSILSQATAAAASAEASADLAEASADLAEAAASNLSIRKYPSSGPLIATAGQTQITPGFTLDTVKDNVAVYVDGVKQARGTYSFTSTTITLSEALTGVETIEVFSADTTAAGSAPLYQANNFSDVLNKAVAIRNLLSGNEDILHRYVYEIGEFYYFRHPTLKPGFAAAQGGLISGVYQGKNITEYPIWAYLQTAEGQLLLKTEAQWQAMTTATWATLADGTTVGWGGIGGAPFYVQNLATGTLRMPDLRGMYAEAAGFDSLGVGGVHGDMIRNIVGTHLVDIDTNITGACVLGAQANSPHWYGAGTSYNRYTLTFTSSRVVPTGAANKPRAWGALACCYLGRPA